MTILSQLLLLLWLGINTKLAWAFSSSISTSTCTPLSVRGRGVRTCRHQLKLNLTNINTRTRMRTSTTSLAFFQRSSGGNNDKVVPEEETTVTSTSSNNLLTNLFKGNDDVLSSSSSSSSSSSQSQSATMLDEKEGYMGDLVKFLRSDQDGATARVTTTTTPTTVDGDDSEEQQLLGQQFVSYGIGAVIASTLLALSASGVSLSLDVTELSLKVQSFFSDPMSALEAVVATVESMGPMGYVYFGAVYTIAEILAIPAIPLTASAGYLFGVRDGTAVVLLSASIAAAVSFIIGRTFLRTYVEKLLEDYPEFQKIDKAIGKEGFKLMLLLRISPIFPFALSNYLYGVTSIQFWPFFWGTMIGFTPGTIAYVFTGEIGKSLTLESAAATAQPWYVYAGGLALLSGFIKVASDVATGIIEEVQQQSEED